MIRLIVEHINSKRDTYGSCYWISKLTSTKTGKSLSFSTPHYSNTEGMINLDWPAIFSIRTELPIREFNRLKKRTPLHNFCKDENIIKMIDNLIKEK